MGLCQLAALGLSAIPSVSTSDVFLVSCSLVQLAVFVRLIRIHHRETDE